MEIHASVTQQLLLLLLLIQLVQRRTSAMASTPLLLPDETLCGHQYLTKGVVVEASHFVSTWKYFSCEIKFNTNSTMDSKFRWILRIERMFIPYAIADKLVAMPPAIHIHTSNETFTIQYKRDITELFGVTIITQKLALQFVNIPKESSYRLVITLDKGESNCSLGFKCPRSGYCIDSSLLCDGADHCGAGDDEQETMCPGEMNVVPIVVAVSGSALGVLLFGLAVALAVRCRSKRPAYYSAPGCRHDRISPSSSRTTFNQVLRQSSLPGSLSAAELNRSLRRSGVGYQPAPLVLRRQSSSSSAVSAGVHSLALRSSEDQASDRPTVRSPSVPSPPPPPSSSPSSRTESVNSTSLLLTV